MDKFTTVRIITRGYNTTLYILFAQEMRTLYLISRSQLFFVHYIPAFLTEFIFFFFFLLITSTFTYSVTQKYPDYFQILEISG